MGYGGWYMNYIDVVKRLWLLSRLHLQWGIMRLCDFWSEISSVFFCISVLNSRKACTEYYSSLEKQVGFDERFEFEAPCHISISKLKQFPDRVWSKNREYGVSLTFGPGLISITPFGWNEHTLTKILRGTPPPPPQLSLSSPHGGGRSQARASGAQYSPRNYLQDFKLKAEHSWLIRINSIKG